MRSKKRYNDFNIKKRSFKNKDKYNRLLFGGNEKSIIQKLCKGRPIEECTGNCMYINGKLRKYCKRKNICKKGCQYPCQKIEFNNKIYCIPPDGAGEPQKLEDVIDILSELEITIDDDTLESSTLEPNTLDTDTSNLQTLDNEILTTNLDTDRDNYKDLYSKPKLTMGNTDNLNKDIVTQCNGENHIHNFEKGSVASVLYMNIPEVNNRSGECSIL